MKAITNKSLDEDYLIVRDLMQKYCDAVYEKQEGQPAHFDNQPKFVKICMCDIRCGLGIALQGLRKITDIKVQED